MPISSNGPAALKLFVIPARSFANSIDATRATTELLRSHASSASQVEADFVAEAEYMYPQYSTEAHATAAVLVHTAVHRFQDARNALQEKSDDRIDEVYRESFGPLEARLEEITGDPRAEHNYQHVWERIASRPSTARLLGSALLTHAVSEFEVLVGRLVRGVLKANPDILLGTDQKFSLRELQDFATVEELRKSLAEDLADRLLRKGFLAWMEWFESKLKVDVPGVFEGSTELTEVFQRRHLMVHNGGVVNEAYLANAAGATDPPAQGTQLRVTRQYLARAVDLLEAAGVKLAAAAALKFATVEGDRTRVEEALDRLCFEALQREHWTVASEVSGWLVPQVRDEPARMRLQVNHWVARKAINGREPIEEVVRSWDTRALTNPYKLARLALLDEHQQALELAITMLETGALDEVDLRTWPVLAGVREHARTTGASLPSTDGWDTSHTH